MNFASVGQVTVELTKNDIRGPLDVIGGLSQPDAVANATTTIISQGNHYSPQAASKVEAWHIVGGSSSPLGGTANTDSNSASIQSTDDVAELDLGAERSGCREGSPSCKPAAGYQVWTTDTAWPDATCRAPNVPGNLLGFGIAQLVSTA
jgi:hypothetical protein